MLLSELRELLKSYNDEELRILVTQMYKLMPKNLRENKEIDELLKNTNTSIKSNQADKTKLEMIDINNLKPQVELFIDYAYKQYYCTANRFVHKKDRPRWRFIVKKYIKDLQQISDDTKEELVAIELLEKLYEMLCYGCGYYIFNTENPFRSIHMDQSELLNIILTRKLTCGIDKVVVRSAILLTINNRANWDMIDSTLINILVANIKSPDAREIALFESISFKKELDSKKSNATKKTWNGSISDFEHGEKIKKVVELVFKLYMALCEYEEGIVYLKKNRLESDKEISLYDSTATSKNACLIKLSNYKN